MQLRFLAHPWQFSGYQDARGTRCASLMVRLSVRLNRKLITMKNASQVGGLVLVFGAMFVGGYAVLGKSFFAPKTTAYTAIFDDAQGVTAGAQVWLAGVKIGQVSEVKLVGGKAQVGMAIEEGTPVPAGVKAVLPTSLIGIGDRQIMLVGGTSGAQSPAEPIPGAIQSPLESFLPDSKGTMKELNNTLVAVQGLLNDKGMKSDLQKLLQQSSTTAEKFGNLASSIEGLVTQNQAKFGAILGQTAAMMQKGNEMLADMRFATRELAKFAQSGTLQTNVESMMVKMNKALDTGNAMLLDIRAFTSDAGSRDQIKAMIKNAESMSASGVAIAKNVDTMTQKGTIIADEAATLSKKANVLADDAHELMTMLKKKLDKLTLPGMGGGGSPLAKVEFDASLFRETRPENRYRAEVNAKLPLGERSLHLGLWDAFESNKLNAQMGIPFMKNSELRAGMYAGKAGIGVDYSLASGLQFKGDLFDINEPRFDLKARFPLGRRDLTGWIGLERIFEKNAPSFGIGIRK